MRRVGSVVLLFSIAIFAGVLLSGTFTPSFATDQDKNNNDDKHHKHDLTIMTYNVYQGSRLVHSFAATTPLEFVQGVAADYNNVIATNFSERAQAIAAEVATKNPDLIGLQQVALWQTQFPSNPSTPATHVTYDFLQILLDALSAKGLHYNVAVVRNNFNVQSPGLFSFGFMDVRLTDRNVILVRGDDLTKGPLTISNVQSTNYTAKTIIPSIVGPINLFGGWESIDVKIKGDTIRFISTHMDSFSQTVRTAQANELLAGPMNTNLPIIFSGDLNADSTSSSLAAFASAGFVDSWAQVNPTDPGFTCCQFPPDSIINPTSHLNDRIDFVLTRGDLDTVKASLVGSDPSSRTPSGLWPSDHAGLVATLKLDKDNNDKK